MARVFSLVTKSPTATSQLQISRSLFPSQGNSTMKTALIYMMGSRGDHEPFFAMALGMLESGKFDRVHLGVQEDYVHFAPKDDRITIHVLPINLADMWPVWYFEIFKATIMSWFTGKSDPVEIQRRSMTAIINRFICPKSMHFYEIARDIQPDTILASIFLTPIATIIAKKLNVPMWIANFQPNTPTEAYPYYMASIENAIKASEQVVQMHKLGLEHELRTDNLKTYDAHAKMHLGTLTKLNAFCDALNIPKMHESDIFNMLSGEMENVGLINSYPSQLVPPSNDWCKNVYQIPSLADDYTPPDWKPEEKCPKLVKYLSEISEKPLVVNFGSMNVQKKGSVTKEIFMALRELGIKNVLLLKAGADLGPHHLSWFDGEIKKWASEHVFISDEPSQHAWLLPQCRAMICHGGAGTTCVGLRSGIPLVISPHLCDQYFWGNLCQALGLGAVAGPCIEEARAASFTKALKIALSDEVHEKAREMGQSMRKEKSAGILAAEIMAKRF